MKKIITTIIFILLSFVSYTQEYTIDYNKMPYQNYISLKKLLPNATNNNFSEFLFDLAFRESNGDWTATNGDHIGLWQLGSSARHDIGKYITGIDFFDTETFYTNPEIFPPKSQKIAISYYIMIIERRLSNHIDKYQGKIINDIYITKSGIIAAGHLIGVENIKKYLDSGGQNIKKDGLNTSLEEYLILYNDYIF